MVAPEGFEPPTFWFVAKRSIQLSYGVTSALFFNSKAIITKTGQIVNTFSKKDSQNYKTRTGVKFCVSQDTSL